MRAFSLSVWRVRDMPRCWRSAYHDRGFSNGGRSGAYDVNVEVEHARRWGCGKIDLAEEYRKMADPAVVAVASFLGDAFELDEAGEVQIPRGRRECVIFFSYA
jgi:hypothetical protein